VLQNMLDNPPSFKTFKTFSWRCRCGTDGGVSAEIPTGWAFLDVGPVKHELLCPKCSKNRRSSDG